MMKMGLISLLLTLSEAPISKICVRQTVANTFLPCEDPLDGQSDHAEPAVSSSVAQLSGSNSYSNLSTTELTSQSYCESKVYIRKKVGVVKFRSQHNLYYNKLVRQKGGVLCFVYMYICIYYTLFIY